MPLITRRSSLRLMPRTSFGRCGSMRCHCSSLSQKKSALIVPRAPQETVVSSAAPPCCPAPQTARPPEQPADPLVASRMRSVPSTLASASFGNNTLGRAGEITVHPHWAYPLSLISIEPGELLGRLARAELLRRLVPVPRLLEIRRHAARPHLCEHLGVVGLAKGQGGRG